MYDPNSVFARTGGRMGGSSFSSSSRSSSSSSSVGGGSSLSSSSRSRSSGVENNIYFTSVGTPSPYPSPPPSAVDLVATIIVITCFLISSVASMVENSTESNSFTDTMKTTVVKLQVGLLGLGKSIHTDLNRIAETTNTSTSEGLHYVLTETSLALLRHPDYCISTYSSVDVKKSMEEGEKRFNELSIEERGKFDEETLVNVNNKKKRQSSTKLKTSPGNNEYIVVTIVVAAEGEHKLPSINNNEDLKEALLKLAAIPCSRIKAVEVLWAPQEEDDILSEREFLESYPLLKPL